MASPDGNIDDDEFLCSSHKSHVVALFCQTCEELICPRCISQGASGSGKHRQHVYLDLMDAYDLKKEEFDKVLTNFRDATQTRKNERAELHSAIQKLKLELLRKKTEATKQTKALRDAIARQEKDYVKLLENIVEPAIVRNELTYKDLDCEVVTRDGLIAMAECTQSISSEKCIQFLRRQRKSELQMVELSAKSEILPQDDLQELATLKGVDLNLHREKSMIKSTLSCPTNGPSRPRFIRSWCHIGSKSATLVFKNSRKVPVGHNLVHCHPYPDTHMKTSNYCTAGGIKENCIMFKIRKFAGSRVNVMLRSLHPGKTYRVEVLAVNNSGSSPPAICYFSTTSVQKFERVHFTEPSVPKCNLFWNVLLCILKVLMVVSSGVVIVWALFGMYMTLDVVILKVSALSFEFCDWALHQNITILSELHAYLCPYEIEQTEITEQNLSAENHDDIDQIPVDLLSFHEVWDWFLSVLGEFTSKQ